MNPRVKAVTPREDFTLEITFQDGQVGRYDCRPLLDFGVFRELQDPNYFRQARVADGTVVWPNAQDICPDTLYLDATRVEIPEPS